MVWTAEHSAPGGSQERFPGSPKPPWVSPKAKLSGFHGRAEAWGSTPSAHHIEMVVPPAGAPISVL